MSLFQRFKKNWDNIHYVTNDLSTIELTGYTNEQKLFLETCIQEVLETIDITERDYKLRDDYQEMLLLTKCFLNI